MLSRLSSETFHTPSNARLPSSQIMFSGIIGKVNIGIIQRDDCNRVRGQQTESGESSDECGQGPGTSALTLRMSRTFTGFTEPSGSRSCRPITLWACLHSGSLNSIHGSRIQEIRAEVYAWCAMYKRSVDHSCDPTAPLSSGGRTSTSTGSNVDTPPSNYGRWLETVVVKASFSLACASPRNYGWRLNRQLAGTLLAIHGRQQCPISGKRETIYQTEGTTHYCAGHLAAESKVAAHR